MGSWGLCLALGGGANRREAAQLGLSCKPALLCGIMEEPRADPDLVDEDVLDIELLDDNLEDEEEEEVEEVFESPRKRPSILLSLTGCSRVALSPFADLEVPQTKLDPPTPSSPLPRSPSQFLRYSELQVFLVNLSSLTSSLFCTGVSPTPAGCREPARRRCTTTRRRKEPTKMTPSVQKGRLRRLIWQRSSGR